VEICASPGLGPCSCRGADITQPGVWNAKFLVFVTKTEKAGLGWGAGPAFPEFNLAGAPSLSLRSVQGQGGEFDFR
jgi:hypothetical protein